MSGLCPHCFCVPAAGMTLSPQMQQRRPLPPWSPGGVRGAGLTASGLAPPGIAALLSFSPEVGSERHQAPPRYQLCPRKCSDQAHRTGGKKNMEGHHRVARDRGGHWFKESRGQILIPLTSSPRSLSPECKSRNQDPACIAPPP